MSEGCLGLLTAAKDSNRATTFCWSRDVCDDSSTKGYPVVKISESVLLHTEKARAAEHVS
jgi:hypothetical protein